MEKTSYAHGEPSWVDLGSADLAGSSAFYTGLFGWQATPAEDPAAGGYVMFEKDGKPVAGLGPLFGEGIPTHWTCYTSVDDADRVAELVSAHGGQVFMPPMDVLDVGRMGVFADPTGASFAVWQPKAHRGAALVGEAGTWCWSELSSRDPAAAAPFYRAVFGWEPTPGPEDYTLFQLGDLQVAGMMTMPEMVPADVPSHWMPYFAVGDTDIALAKANTLGASTLAGPFDMPVGRFVVMMDPQGAPFALIALAG